VHSEITYAHPNIITAGSSGRISKLGEFLTDVKTINSSRGLLTVHGTYKGHKITGYTTGMGPSSVSITLPEAIEACDENDMIILRLGTSGGLQEFLNVGDFVVTTGVERHESTSDKIMGDRYVAIATPEVANALFRTANRTKLPSQKVYAGMNITTDELYLFNKYLHSLPHHRAHTVSMEASVHFALRDKYNHDDGRDIKAGELLVVSDNIVKKAEHIDATEFDSKKKQLEEILLQTGLETIAAMRSN
jgi:uridine phosphorylase